MAAPDPAPTAAADDDRPILWEPSRTFLRHSTICMVAGCLAVVVVLRVVAPDQWLRAAMVALLGGLGGVVAILLHRGRLQAGFVTMALAVWGHSTLSSILFGGVNSVSSYLYPLPILLIGWLVHTRAAVALAACTALVTLAIALLELQGVLPPLPPTSPILRWLVQACVFMLSAALIASYTGAYRNRLVMCDG